MDKSFPTTSFPQHLVPVRYFPQRHCGRQRYIHCPKSYIIHVPTSDKRTIAHAANYMSLRKTLTVLQTSPAWRVLDTHKSQKQNRVVSQWSKPPACRWRQSCYNSYAVKLQRRDPLWNCDTDKFLWVDLSHASDYVHNVGIITVIML